jgi:DNA-binding NarL/FixJ family response regulator
MEIGCTFRNTAAMTVADPIRVLIAEDHPIMRQSLRIILEAFPNVQVVGEAVTGEEAVVSAGNLQPHIILMDVNLPLLDGIAATRVIRTKYPYIAVIGLSCHSPRDLMPAMTKAGAFEVLPKEKALNLYEVMQRAVTCCQVTQGGSTHADRPPAGTSLLS